MGSLAPATPLMLLFLAVPAAAAIPGGLGAALLGMLADAQGLETVTAAT